MATAEAGLKHENSNNGVDEETFVFDNWEEIAEADDIDLKLERMKPSSYSSETTCESRIVSSSTGMQFLGSQPVILQGDDSHRTQYVPPEPQVKILRRPEKTSFGKLSNGTIPNGFNYKPKQTVKTLEQREAEYAEARLRILGEAKNPEDTHDDKVSKLLLKPSNVVRQPKGPDGTVGFQFQR